MVKDESHCYEYTGYSFQLAYHSLGYTSRGALAGTRNSLMRD